MFSIKIEWYQNFSGTAMGPITSPVPAVENKGQLQVVVETITDVTKSHSTGEIPHLLK